MNKSILCKITNKLLELNSFKIIYIIDNYANKYNYGRLF